MARTTFNIDVKINTNNAGRSLSALNTQLEKIQKGAETTVKSMGNVSSSIGTMNTQMQIATQQSTGLLQTITPLASAYTAMATAQQKQRVETRFGNVNLKSAQNTFNTTKEKVDLLTKAYLTNEKSNKSNTNALKQAHKEHERARAALAKLKERLGETSDGQDELAKSAGDLWRQFSSGKVSISNLDRGFAALARSITRVEVGVGVFIIAMGAASVATARLVRDLTTLSRTDTRTIQEFSMWAERYGLQAQQAADISKDWNDRLGDFAQTGGGGFKEVFAAINMGLEDFAGLTPVEGMIKLKDAMDDANLSAAEQTFAFETLGNDLSRLQDGLADSGKSYREFQNTIAGATLSSTAAADLNSLGNEFTLFTKLLKNLVSEITAIFAPLVTVVFKGLNFVLVQTIKLVKLLEFAALGTALALAKVADNFMDNSDEIAILEKKIDGVIASYEDLGNVTQDTIEKEKALAAQQKARMEQERKLAEQRIATGDKYVRNLQWELAIMQATTPELKKQITHARSLLGQDLTDAQFARASALLEQIHAQQKLNEATEKAIKLAADQKQADEDRDNAASEVIRNLHYQLETLQAVGEAEKTRTKLLQQLDLASLTAHEREYAEALVEQIVAREELNRKLAENKKIEQDKIKAQKEIVKAEQARIKNIDEFIVSQQRELVLLKERDDTLRRQLSIEHEIIGLQASGARAQVIRDLDEQIRREEELIKLQEQYDRAAIGFFQNLTRYALGSKEAMIGLIAEMIKLITLSTNFQNNNFVQGLVGGLGGAFADGGNPPIGKASLVGERGPELIVPRAAMTVIPNHEMGGVTVQPQINFNGNVSNPAEMEAMMTVFAQDIAVETKRLISNQRRR